MEHFLRIPYKDYPGYFKRARVESEGDGEVDEMKQVNGSAQ